MKLLGIAAVALAALANVPATATAQSAFSDTPSMPVSMDQCKNGGWPTYGVFKNQGGCVSFVATGGKNPSAGTKKP